MQLDKSDGRYAMNYMRKWAAISRQPILLILFLLNFSKNNESRNLSAHIGETFYCFRKALYGLICIAMFNAIADTVFDVTF